MVSCAAFGCTNRGNRLGVSGITFHRFPSDTYRRNLWMKAVRRKNWVPTRHSALCSTHFTEKCFDRTSSSLVRIRSDAIPTIFNFPDAVRKEIENEVMKKIKKGTDHRDENEELGAHNTKQPERFDPISNVALPVSGDTNRSSANAIIHKISVCEPDGIVSPKKITAGNFTTKRKCDASVASEEKPGEHNTTGNNSYLMDDNYHDSTKCRNVTYAKSLIISQMNAKIYKLEEINRDYRKKVKTLQQKVRRLNLKVNVLETIVADANVKSVLNSELLEISANDNVDYDEMFTAALETSSP